MTRPFPQGLTCVLCGQALTPDEGALCADCQAALRECALPNPMLTLADFLLRERWPDAEAEHAQSLRTVDALISAFAYAGAAKELAHTLKYGNRLAAALPLCERMAGAWAAFGHPGELLAPVPLHPRRLKKRGYNQAEALCELLSFHTGLPVCANALTRTVYTPPQVGQSAGKRLANMREVFAASPQAKGRDVLLVDDVLTTGATAFACAEALRRAGAARVSVLTACRTPSRKEDARW